MRERVILLGTPVAALAAALIAVAGASVAVAGQRLAVGAAQPADGRAAPSPGAGADARTAEGATVDWSAVIVGPSACPLPEAVWAELGTLVPPERLARRLTATAVKMPAVQIIDLGIPYRVIAAGRIREYRDEARDCSHRARVAAVFVALTFDPPVGAAPAASAQAAPAAGTVVAAPAVVSTSKSEATEHVARLDIGGGADAGLGPDGHITQAGLTFRLAMGRGVWSLVVGTAASLPVDISVNGLRLRHWRLPAEVGVRARFIADSIEPYCEVGLGAALLSERALDLGTNEGHTAVELGAFAALGLRFTPSDRFAPFIAVRAELVPGPPAIQVLPRGVVGHTPLVWLGAAAGVSIDFH